MKNLRIHEYSIQTVFALLDSALIIGGSMFTAAAMKVGGYPDPDRIWPPFPVFVRNWGFLLILIPAIWVVWTIWAENNRRESFGKKWTFLTGIVVFAGLAYAMAAAVLMGSGAGRLVAVAE